MYDYWWGMHDHKGLLIMLVCITSLLFQYQRLSVLREINLRLFFSGKNSWIDSWNYIWLCSNVFSHVLALAFLLCISEDYSVYNVYVLRINICNPLLVAFLYMILFNLSYLLFAFLFLFLSPHCMKNRRETKSICLEHHPDPISFFQK